MLFLLLIFIFIIIILTLNTKETFHKETKLNNIQQESKKINNTLYNYRKKDYVMTQTELIFYRKLKTITDKLELYIFPQVNLERIVKVKDNNFIDRNRIKSRSIDFTIVNNKNCKIVCCIELDDYTHNYKNRIKRDIFINNLFSNVGIKLYRIKVNNNYNLEEIENKIKESL